MCKRVVFAICIGIICDCCNFSKTDQNASLVSYKKIYSDNSIKFANDDQFVGKILSFDFLNDSTFAFATTNPAGVFVFNMSGEKMYQNTSKGRGPGEFLSPSILRVYNDTLFIWCSKQLKLHMYDKNLSYIGEISSLDTRAINDFIIYKDIICFYHSGGWREVISVFNRNAAEYVYSCCLGSEEHKVLQTNSVAGGMILMNDCLYFTYTDRLCLFKLSLDSYNLEEFLIISDNEFIVSELNTSADEIINTKREMLIDYLMTNSCVKGLYLYHNKIIIKAEIGFYKQKKISNTVDYSNRGFKYYIVTPDKQIETISMRIERDLDLEYYPVYKGHNDKFFSITAHLENDSFYYQLNQLEFQ